jgi:GntR family transcriptional regulator/MocR family aminotransferase
MNGKIDLASVSEQGAHAPTLALRVERAIRNAIENGQFPRGTRLASSRSLAAQLGIARGTVDEALEQLKSEGMLISRGPRGTFVASQVNQAVPRLEPPLAAQSAPEPASTWTWPYRVGVPALDLFPYKIWARFASRRARCELRQDPSPSPAAGLLSLRSAIARHLALTRCISADPSRIFVTAGYQAALGMILSVLLQKDDCVWCEEPGYYPTRTAIARFGGRVQSVPVDEQGLDVSAARRLAAQGRLAIVTPAHQSPTGVSLSAGRRVELVNWAKSAEAWILEDDYDGEYRYGSRPIAALAASDESRVIYVGTFSKTLTPALRVGYLVVPPGLATPFATWVRELAPASNRLTQGILADFMNGGHYARHVRRMRQVYARRRAATVHALMRAFADSVQIELARGGMHILARFRTGATGTALANAARAAGAAPLPIALFYAQPMDPPTLVMGFANLPEIQAEREAERLKQALRPYL